MFQQDYVQLQTYVVVVVNMLQNLGRVRRKILNVTQNVIQKRNAHVNTFNDFCS